MTDCTVNGMATHRERVGFVCVQVERLVERVDIHIQILNVAVLVMPL